MDDAAFPELLASKLADPDLAETLLFGHHDGILPLDARRWRRCLDAFDSWQAWLDLAQEWEGSGRGVEAHAAIAAKAFVPRIERDVLPLSVRACGHMEQHGRSRHPVVG